MGQCGKGRGRASNITGVESAVTGRGRAVGGAPAARARRPSTAAARGVGAARFVETLLRDRGGDARLAPTLLPLLCAVLLEADDDEAAEESSSSRDARLDAADAARAPLWAALFDALAAHEQWRPVISDGGAVGAAALVPILPGAALRRRRQAGARGALRRAGAAGGHAPARAGRGVVGRGSR